MPPIFRYLPDPNAGATPARLSFVQIYEASSIARPGTTPLMRAAGRGEISEVERLLAAQPDPNATDPSGWTPLMFAAGGRAPAETLPKLLAAGANPRAKTTMGQTALMAAAWSPLEARIRQRLAELEKTERPVEYRFSLPDGWAASLFIALLHRYDLKPYRRRSQRHTVMVRVTPSFAEEIRWPQFQQLNRTLSEHLC